MKPTPLVASLLVLAACDPDAAPDGPTVEIAPGDYSLTSYTQNDDGCDAPGPSIMTEDHLARVELGELWDYDITVCDDPDFCFGIGGVFNTGCRGAIECTNDGTRYLGAADGSCQVFRTEYVLSPLETGGFRYEQRAYPVILPEDFDCDDPGAAIRLPEDGPLGECARLDVVETAPL